MASNKSHLNAVTLAISAFLMGILTAIPAVAQETQASSARPPRLIEVTGTGEAGGKPDIALTSLTVLRTGDTARAAADAANADMAAVVAAMKARGIQGRDLQTSGFAISPQYRYVNAPDGTQTPPTLVGYEVRSSLAVIIRDLTKTGEIIDQAVTLGVNQGGDISFTIENPAPLRAEARRRAVADAMETATVLSEAAGVALGDVVSITIGESDLPPQPMVGRALAAAAPMDKAMEVEAGETTIRASVRIAFEIAAKAGK